MCVCRVGPATWIQSPLTERCGAVLYLCALGAGGVAIFLEACSLPASPVGLSASDACLAYQLPGGFGRGSVRLNWSKEGPTLWKLLCAS